MSYDIPAGMLREAAAAFDTLLARGKECVLEFPLTRAECPNCLLDATTGRSAGAYRPGGASPFPTGTVCPVCRGEGAVDAAESRTIRMTVQDDPAKWAGAVPPQVPDGTVQTRCALEHYALLASCRRMRVAAEGYRGRVYELWGDPVDAFQALAGRWVLALWRRA